MSHRGQYWTDEQIEQLKTLYALVPRLSASEIAAELSGGFSRNAVIGKIHRLGLPLRGQRPRALRAKRVRTETLRIVRANANSNAIRIIESATLEQPKLRCVEVEPRNVALVDLSAGGCRYPYGDGPFVFCDHPTIDGSPYCQPHQALTTAQSRTVDEAVREARRRRIRGVNFRRALLEAMP
jgi:GcrA cell cycle regulator